MTDQQNLFDLHDPLPAHCGGKPLARNSDPETSKQGAAYVAPELNKLQAEFVRRLSVLGAGTANEVAAGSETIRKRAGECLRLGAIRVIGTRNCAVTKRRARVYQVTSRAGETRAGAR